MRKIQRLVFLLTVVVCGSQAFGQQSGSFPVRIAKILDSNQKPGTVDSKNAAITVTFVNGLVIQSVPAKNPSVTQRGQVVVKFPSGVVLPPFKNTELSVDGDGITLTTYEIFDSPNGQDSRSTLTQRIEYGGSQAIYVGDSGLISINVAGALDAKHKVFHDTNTGCWNKQQVYDEPHFCWDDASVKEIADGRYVLDGNLATPILFWRWLTDANPSPNATSSGRQSVASNSEDLNKGANIRPAQVQQNLEKTAAAFQQPQ